MNSLLEGLGMDLEAANQTLAAATAEERVAYALGRWKPNILLTSSFGAQAAVLLHMVTQQWLGIPVVLLDTQYLFPETYRFVDELTARLGLNLKVYQSPISREWQEARWGKLWEGGVEGITRSTRSTRSSRWAAPSSTWMLTPGSRVFAGHSRPRGRG